jgi:hypothetical protein
VAIDALPEDPTALQVGEGRAALSEDAQLEVFHDDDSLHAQRQPGDLPVWRQRIACRGRGHLGG